MPAVSPVEHISPQASQPETPPAVPVAERPFAHDKYENMESFQQKQMTSQMLCLEAQTKTNLIAQQFQTLSAIKAKDAEIQSSIASKIAR